MVLNEILSQCKGKERGRETNCTEGDATHIISCNREADDRLRWRQSERETERKREKVKLIHISSNADEIFFGIFKTVCRWHVPLFIHTRKTFDVLSFPCQLFAHLICYVQFKFHAILFEI